MTNLYHATMAALEARLTCSLIASELDHTSGLPPLCTKDDELLKYATDNQFSHIPLCDSKSHAEDGDRRITHVATINLVENRVTERRAVEVYDLLSGATPINKAPELLKQREFFFVLEGNRIHSILTPSDLNRLPMRTYLHTLLDHVEGMMADAIEKEYCNDTWQELLLKAHVKSAKWLHAKKARADFATRLIDCTTLADKATIVGRTETLRSRLGTDSLAAFDGRFKAVNKSRNRISHGSLLSSSEQLDDFRNQLSHAGPIIIKRDEIPTLCEVLATLDRWIAALSSTSEATA